MSKYEKPDFGSMAGPALVNTYNEMVLTAIDLGITGYKTVSRFSDLETGVKRSEMLHSSIVANRKGREEEAARDAEGEATTTAPVIAETEPQEQKKESEVSAAKTKTRRGRPASIDLDTKLDVKAKENPRTGEGPRKRFDVWKSGMTPRQYGTEARVNQSIALRDARHHVKQGWLGIKK